MKNSLFSLTALALLGSGVAQAVPQVFVDETFESYADTAAVINTWIPSATAANYTLIDQTYSTVINSTTFEPYPLGQKAFDPTSTGATGKGLEFVGIGVLELDIPTLNGGQPLLPTAEKSVVVAGDIFDVNAHGNKRRSIGLRNSNAENLIEMGFWNTSTIGYAARAVNFAGPAPDPGAVGAGGWFFMELDPALDGPDTGTTVTQFDIGEAWHRYEVIITPTSLTYTLDLFRDGINNVTEATGVDYSITYEGLDTTAAGFNKIRFGGPSGNSSTGQTGYGGVVFDNIYLALEDAIVEPTPLVGDYTGDGLVDAADYTLWRDTLGTSVTAGTGADGNGNGVIDGPAGAGSDYNLWATNYGATPAPSSSVTIPEPASLALVALGLVAVARRR